MPKSKRSRVVSLTQAKRKGRQAKEALLAEVRGCVDSYAYLMVFSVHNLRTAKLKELRAKMPESRVFMGRNKVTKIALGRSEEEEYKEGLHQVSEQLVGSCGILFTNTPPAKVLAFMAQYKDIDFARAGFVSDRTVALGQGPLPQFAHPLEPHLRKLGLPTSLKEGVILLERDFVVCSTGDTLTPEQCRILKLLDVKLSEFRLRPVCSYAVGTGQFTQIAPPV